MGSMIEAVTFDFGNTLVPVGNAALGDVVARTADRVAARSGPFDAVDFIRTWNEERDRQFAEEVPKGREVDLEQRMIRVLARLRGLAPPPAAGRWDDASAARLSTADERAAAVEAYSAAFVEVIPVPPDVGPLLDRLATRWRLAVLSNWPLAAMIERFLEAAGWRNAFRAVVISQRVGSIKPARAIFDICESALGVPGSTILHVGDDWIADVVGARRAGWRTAYLRGRQVDSPLPSSEPDASAPADIVIDRLADLEAAIDRLGGRARTVRSDR
jgi:putative hydrolase of the HAD superfamily